MPPAGFEPGSQRWKARKEPLRQPDLRQPELEKATSLQLILNHYQLRFERPVSSPTKLSIIAELGILNKHRRLQCHDSKALPVHTKTK